MNLNVAFPQFLHYIRTCLSSTVSARQGLCHASTYTFLPFHCTDLSPGKLSLVFHDIVFWLLISLGPYVCISLQLNRSLECLTLLIANFSNVDPKDIPAATPIVLPGYQPFAKHDQTIAPDTALPHLLKQTGRMSIALGPAGLTALGLDLRLDVDSQDMLPNSSFGPDFEKWDSMSAEQARVNNESTRTSLRNGSLSPGCQEYFDRKRELSNLNEDAFRTVRRISPPKGKQHARLGNAYEFFRCLELFTTFWDDPTQPASLPPSPELPSSTSGGCLSPETAPDNAIDFESRRITRTASGDVMPPEYRQNLLSAFIKFVAYDFGCNTSMSRVEPRLHLNSPPGNRQRKSYTASNCHFVFQSPMTREAARAGLVYGPLAAVSVRPTVNFSTPDIEAAQSLDLAREVMAALITAQHRTREGREEVRFGRDTWWTTRRRWGGGSGGPIGREIERDGGPEGTIPRGGPVPKRPRKTMPIYDNYRMVRAPASTWDRRAKYEAIGRCKESHHDDIFVISSLFHHVSLIRVRVPLRLLEVLDGSPEPDATRRSWETVPAWRSRWFDLFDIDQRIAAMQLIWGMMAYQMRQDTN